MSAAENTIAANKQAALNCPAEGAIVRSFERARRAPAARHTASAAVSAARTGGCLLRHPLTPAPVARWSAGRSSCGSRKEDSMQVGESQVGTMGLGWVPITDRAAALRHLPYFDSDVLQRHSGGWHQHLCGLSRSSQSIPRVGPSHPQSFPPGKARNFPGW